MRSWWPADSGAAALPVLLDAVTEGAWLTIAYLLVRSLPGGAPPRLGIVELSVLAGTGIVLVRGGRRLPDSPLLLAAATALAGLAGWLADDAARASLSAGDVIGSLAAHPAGWLAALAVARAAVHADPAEDDRVVGQMLSWGIPGLAVVWTLVQSSAPVARATVTEPVFVATLSFATAALLAVAVGRLEALGVTTRKGGSSRPWLALLAGVVLLITAIGLPVAAFLGLPLDTAIRGALGPLAIVLEVAVIVLAVPFGILAGALIELLRGLGGTGQTPTATLPAQVADHGGAGPQLPPVVLGPLLVFAAVVAGLVFLFLLARVARRVTLPRRSAAPDEERHIEIPHDIARLGRPRLGWHLPERRRTPADAVAAYLALLRDIGGTSAVAREPGETPRSHARRLRDAGAAGLSLDLLAADYALARYGARSLSGSEQSRAVGRWRRLRQELRDESPKDDR